MNAAAMRNSEPRQASVAGRRVLYVGRESGELNFLVAPKSAEVELCCKSVVYDAFLTLRQSDFDYVVVDQRGGELATKLILPVLRTLPKLPFIIVLCQPGDVGSYLNQPGVKRVLAAPLQRVQLFSVLGLGRERSAAGHIERPNLRPVGKSTVTATATPQAKNRIFLIRTKQAKFTDKIPLPAFPSMSNLVAAGRILASGLYVNATTIMLAALTPAFLLFAALTFISLFSTNWGMPVALSKGHELVASAEAELAELRAKLENFRQRIADVRLDEEIAQQTATHTKALIQYFEANITGLLKLNDKQFRASRELLLTLKARLAGQKEGNLPANSPVYFDLVQESLQARMSFDLAQLRGKAASQKLKELESSRFALETRISELEASPLGRATKSPIIVLFVPRDNEKFVGEGSDVFSCSMAVIWCSRIGAAGKYLPGNSSSVQEMFGKPVHGSFIEVHFDSPQIAASSIVYANSPPLSF